MTVSGDYKTMNDSVLFELEKRQLFPKASWQLNTKTNKETNKQVQTKIMMENIYLITWSAFFPVAYCHYSTTFTHAVPNTCNCLKV